MLYTSRFFPLPLYPWCTDLSTTGDAFCPTRLTPSCIHKGNSCGEMCLLTIQNTSIAFPKFSFVPSTPRMPHASCLKFKITSFSQTAYNFPTLVEHFLKLAWSNLQGPFQCWVMPGLIHFLYCMLVLKTESDSKGVRYVCNRCFWHWDAAKKITNELNGKLISCPTFLCCLMCFISHFLVKF